MTNPARPKRRRCGCVRGGTVSRPLTARSTAVAHVPARAVPVAAVFGNLDGHDDEVGDADGDLLVASRAQVGLARLERMDERDFEVVAVHADKYVRQLWRPSKSTGPTAS